MGELDEPKSTQDVYKFVVTVGRRTYAPSPFRRSFEFIVQGTLVARHSRRTLWGVAPNNRSTSSRATRGERFVSLPNKGRQDERAADTFMRSFKYIFTYRQTVQLPNCCNK